MAATILTVAAAAGVSTASVSRFLRGDTVRAADAIRDAIAALDYRPTIAARALRSGVHYAIAMVVPDITNPFFAALAKGVEAAFRATPYHVFLCNSDEQALIEAAVLDDVAPRVDGIIIAPTAEDDPAPLALRLAGMPIVLVDRDLAGGSLDCVLVDNEGGAAEAARHLHALGHTDVALIGGPLGNTPGRTRHAGFTRELGRLGLALRPECLAIADFREAGGATAMHRLMALDPRPTAVFCANNAMTVGALKALAARGLAVGRDVSLIGFDDLDLASLLDPPLTVIDRSPEDQGEAAARLMLRRLAAPENTPAGRVPASHPAERIVLPTRLVVRASCRPPSRGQAQARPATPTTPTTPTSMTPVTVA